MAGEGKEVGRVSIRVVADVEKFRPKVEREARTLDDIEIRIDPDFDKKKLEAEVKEAATSTKGEVSFTGELDTKGLREKVHAAVAALRESIKVVAELEANGLPAKVKALAKEAYTHVPVDIRVNVSKFLAEVRSIKEATRRHLSEIKIGFKQLTLVKDVTRAAMGARRAAEFVLKDIPLRVSQSSVVREVALLHASFAEPIKAKVKLASERLVSEVRAAKLRAKFAWGSLTVGLSAKLDKFSVAKAKATVKRAMGNLRFNVDVAHAGVLNDLAALREKASGLLSHIKMGITMSPWEITKEASKGKTLAEIVLRGIKGNIILSTKSFLDKVVAARNSADGILKDVIVKFELETANLLYGARAVRAGLERILSNVPISVSLSKGAKTITARAKALKQRIEQALHSTVGVRFQLAAGNVIQSARALRGGIEAVMDNIEMRFHLASNTVYRNARKLRARIESAVRSRVNFEPVTTPLMRAAAAAKARAERALGKIEAKLGIKDKSFVAKCHALAKLASARLKVKARLTVDKKRFMKDMAVLNGLAVGFVRPFGKLFGGKVFVDVAKNLTAMKGALAVATVAVGSLMTSLSALGAVTWSALTAMVKLTAAMAPAALLSFGLGLGTIVKSFSGFLGVLKAKNFDELNEAIAGMGPAAQKGARGIFAIKDAFSQAASGVQEAFWGAMGQDLAALAPIGRMVGGAMVDIARASGEAAKNTARFLASGRGMEIMSNLIDHASNATQSISRAFFNWIPGVLAVGSAGSKLFDDLLSGISQTAQAWSDRMVRGFADGSLQASLQSMLDEVKAFGSALGDVGHVIGAVFSAASESGAGAINTMRDAASAAAEWVDSAEGSAALSSFFDAMAGVAQTMGPLLLDVATVITSTVAPAISDFIQALGPGMTDLVNGFADALERLAPLAGPLGTALGAVMSAIGPMLPAMAPLVPVVAALAGGFMLFQQVSPIIGALSGVLGALSAPLLAVAGVAGFFALAVSQVDGASSQLGQAFQRVGDAVSPIIDSIKQFGDGVMQALQPAFAAAAPVVTQFVDAVRQIIDALSPVIGTIMQIAGALVSAFAPVLTAIMPIISAVISVVVGLVVAFAPVLNIILQVAGAFITLLANIVGFVASGLAAIVGFVAAVVAGFVGMVANVISAVAGWVSGVLAKAGELVNGFLAKCSELWSQTVSTFSQGVTRAVSEVKQMPSKAKAALGDLGSFLLSSGKALIQGFINGIKSMVGAAKDAVSGVLNAVRGAFPFSPAKWGPFSGRGYTTYSGKALMEGFAEGISSGAGSAVGAVEDVLAQVRAPFDQLNKGKILQPVLEANAKKIHDSRKKEQDAYKKHLENLEKADKAYAERVAKIHGKSAGKQLGKALESKNKRVLKENERYAKQIAGIRDKLNKSIEAPDYSKMDLSINKYFVEGAKELLQNQLLNDYRAVSGQFKNMVNQAISFARSRVGDHPILGQIAWNVNSKEFDFAVEKLIKDSGIAKIPIEFVATNLDKLKSDLGMGNGVISKSIDAAMAFNRNKSDFNNMVHGTKEVHYHVEDMDEAIRLEQLRERKQLMGMG
ncbi:hypothetical protein [Corynebacterium pyruviciproducens]|uniref:Tape measure protein n=1 Tax=Corynebacterium pyruviciproducens TaxID=598660 RepID=A0AAF0YWT5_9CORY|nr:hypothetical protein [Corynebacterium pyruviciproducens]WOT03369.1 hypothetical protein CYJ47_06345 [Corynebacterium pyruviciproducens]